jgi:DNA-binding transcriptional ArsR family regulator
MPRTELAVEQRLIKALAHPIRLRALTIFNQRVASPSEIAHELGEPLGVVSYHVRILENLDCIELVRTTPKRGAIEHHYRALERPWITDEQMEQIPASVRHTLSGSVFAQLAEDVSVAGQGDGLDEVRHWMVRCALVLDDPAWAELGELLQGVLDRAVELQVETIERLAAADGDPAETRSAILGLMLFERHVAEHDRARRAAKAGKRRSTSASGRNARSPRPTP